MFDTKTPYSFFDVQGNKKAIHEQMVIGLAEACDILSALFFIKANKDEPLHSSAFYNLASEQDYGDALVFRTCYSRWL